jgi:hypothetical protein
VKAARKSGWNPEAVVVTGADTMVPRSGHRGLVDPVFENGGDTCHLHVAQEVASVSVVIGRDESAACLSQTATVISA